MITKSRVKKLNHRGTEAQRDFMVSRQPAWINFSVFSVSLRLCGLVVVVSDS